MATPAADTLTRAIVDVALDGVIVMDERGVLRELNPAAERIFGHRREEAIGRPLGEVVVPAHLRAAHAAGLARLLATGQSRMLGRMIETEGVRADGTVFPIELAIVEAAAGGERLFVAHVRDIAARQEAERALRESEARCRAIAEGMPVPVLISDPDTAEVLFANGRAEEVFGLKAGDTITSIWADPAARRRYLARVAADGLVRDIEAVLIRADGGRMDALVSARAVEHGSRAAVLAAIVDVTEQRRAEEARRRSEQLFRAIVEDQTEFIIRFGPDLTVTTLNRAFAEQVGRPREELVGLSVLELVEERRRDWFQAQLASLTPEGPIVSYETDVLLPDGGRGWEQWTDRALFDEQGHLVGYQSVGRDVTAAKRAEEELRDSEQRFRAVVEDQTELICRFDADFRLTFTNAAHAKLFGKEPDELLGQDLFETIPEPARSRLQAGLAARTPDDPIARGENEKVLPTGEVRWFEWTNRVLFDPEGRVIGYQSVGRDVTERREAEREIARQRDMLHQQDKLTALGSLLAGVAHELNNPLAVVVGRAIMLEEQVRDPAVADSLRRLREAAERCAKIVKTFLATARQKPRERRPVALGGVLDAALDMLAYGLKTAGVEVARELEPGLPAVPGDEDLLHQVFLNLLVNAQQALRDAPPPRRVLLRARREGGLVRVEVADNGPGIPAAIRKRIFEPFFTTKPEGSGTGIGLSVCHAVIAAHDGTIEVDDAPGGGARFTIVLPTAPAESPAAGVAAGTETGPAPTPTGRVLVVDDEPEILALLEEVLRRDGYAVELAGSGREALARIDGQAFDLIISDVRMPDVDGRELYRLLRAGRPDLADRVLFLTGDTLGLTLADLPGLDPEALIEKPVTPAAVRDAVRRRLARPATA